MDVDSRADVSTTNPPSVPSDLQYVVRSVHKPATLKCDVDASPSTSSSTSPPDLNTCTGTRGELTETGLVSHTGANDNASTGDVPVLFLYPQSRVGTQAYPKAEWDAKKPTLHNLYMARGLSLQMVMQIMAQEWDFHPT